MIQWLLLIDSFNFPIAILGTRRTQFISRATDELISTIAIDSIVNGEDIPDRDGPEYDDRERPPQERDYMTDDYEQSMYEHRDEYDWRYEGHGMGQTWSYSDETLPMIERYI